MNNNKRFFTYSALLINIFNIHIAVCGGGSLKAKELLSAFRSQAPKESHTRRSENFEPGTHIEMQHISHASPALPKDAALKRRSQVLPGQVIQDLKDNQKVTLKLDTSSDEHEEKKSIRCFSFFCLGK